MEAGVSTDRSRLLALEGALNLRDFGGYSSARGGQVRRNMLYRSGAMHRLSAEAENHLVGLGIAVVWDLRRRAERESEPTRWCAAGGTELIARDHQQTSGVLEVLLREKRLDSESAREAMTDLYKLLPYEHAPSYRDIFARLLAGQVPLLFHCAAGKDRTGVGAALILSALDVPREAILADYALTAEVADFGPLLKDRYAHVPYETMAPLLASEPAYLEAMFGALGESHGGVDAYLEDELGVGPCERARLRGLLVH